MGFSKVVQDIDFQGILPQLENQMHNESESGFIPGFKDSQV